MSEDECRQRGEHRIEQSWATHPRCADCDAVFDWLGNRWSKDPQSPQLETVRR